MFHYILKGLLTPKILSSIAEALVFLFSICTLTFLISYMILSNAPKPEMTKKFFWRVILNRYLNKTLKDK